MSRARDILGRLYEYREQFESIADHGGGFGNYAFIITTIRDDKLLYEEYLRLFMNKFNDRALREKVSSLAYKGYKKHIKLMPKWTLMDDDLDYAVNVMMKMVRAGEKEIKEF